MRNSYITRFVFLFFNLICGAVMSQVSIVKDVNVNPASINPDNYLPNEFCKCGDYLYFTLENTAGSEIWKTDGTDEGTTIVKDINKGSNGGSTIGACLNNKMIFSGNDGGHNYEPWITDGTSNGTQLLKELVEGGETGHPTNFTAFNDGVFFTTSFSGSQSTQLWTTDGTSENTINYATIPDSYLLSVKASQTYVYVWVGDNSATDPNEQFQLWRSDGTAAGTEVIFKMKYFSAQMKAVDEKVFIVTYNDNTSKYDLFAKESSESEFVKLLETENIDTFCEFNDQVIFNSGYTTFISDGTIGGTRSLTSIKLDGGVVFDGLFYGVGYDGVSELSNVLFQTDGTVGGTSTITSLGGGEYLRFFGGYSDIPVLGDHFILPIYDPVAGLELGISDRTSPGTQLIKDIRPGIESSYPRSWVELNGKIYFIANDGTHGGELWATDGTTAGTSLIKDTRPGTENGQVSSVYYPLYEFNNNLYFIGATQGYGSTSGLYQVKEDGDVSLNESFIDFPIYLGKNATDLFFYLDQKLMKTNGSPNGLTLIKNNLPSTHFYVESESGVPFSGYFVNGKNLFRLENSSAGGEYWVTDGTSDGTSILKDIYSGPGSAITLPIGSVVGSQFVFPADNGTNGTELWVTDGTEAGTKLIKDIYPGSTGSYPYNLVTANNKVFFVASDGVNGSTLWMTDGTTEGTSRVMGLAPSSTPFKITSMGSYVLFVVYDYTFGWGLWKSDGTAEGTTLVKYIAEGNLNAGIPDQLTSIGGLLYFSADDGVHGNELWVSDGTSEGTRMIDINPGAEGSDPKRFTPGSDLAFFSANGQLWVSNGTAERTIKIADIEPLKMVYHSGAIYITGYTSAYGREVYKVEVQQESQTIEFDIITPRVMGGDPFAIAARASSGLPVTFSFTSDKITLTGNEITIDKPGSVTLKAHQAGNFLTLPAEAEQTFCINPLKPTIESSPDSSGAFLLQSSSEAGNEWFFNDSSIEGANGHTFLAEETGAYSVQIQVENCKSEKSDQANVVVSGLNDNHYPFLYPNPATSLIYFQSDHELGSMIEIMDSKGQILEKFEMRSGSHSIQGYPRGMYIVRIASSNGVVFAKFIKE